jgi:2-keto-4-pentenoate hydratase/2-oxohepta-3-ene-1,7-dioic acid hydratase in catechol pathway
MVRCLLRLGNRFHGVIPPSPREVKTRAPVPHRRLLLNGSLPIDRPGKIVCVGLNYRDHAEEQGLELPPRPLLFAKWHSALVGPGEPILLPHSSREVDYEAELGVVIGTRARGLSVDDALSVVAGYVCVNDVTARDAQFSDGQWTRAKSFDTFCPVGPELVPAAQIPDPQALGIRCLVNGEALQDSTTAQMVFSIAEILAFVSEAITLEPGDLVATGTPAGVGYTRTPPRFLAPGDEVTVEIEGVGALTNPVRADGA